VIPRAAAARSDRRATATDPCARSRRLRLASHGREPADTSLVVGHSLHPASDTALHVAVDLARRLRADLHVVHGADLFDYPVDPDAADWDQQARRALDEQRRRVAAALADAPLGWTYHAGHGDPARLITEVAEETDALMIIVGSRGQGPGAAFERLLSGSVSRTVLRRQHRPVLVVPGGPRPAPPTS
jgi:nucleotide-binding universal stress UspA family protein